MKYMIQFCLGAMVLLCCNSTKNKQQVYKSDQLEIKQLKGNVFQHISYLNTKTYGKYPCNGMIYINDNEAIIFDTPTNKEASKELINWLGDKDIIAVVATHFHIDCIGGLAEFHSKGINSYATDQTIELALANKEKVVPQHRMKTNTEFKVGNSSVYAKYYGEGHTKDNIIGYIPTEKTLFGGCLIKHLEAPKGNLSDANVADWSLTVEHLKSDLPEIELVIPGHGRSGGSNLLDYTIDQFKGYSNRIVFFFHNRFLETHTLAESHPEFGRTYYEEIISQFEKNGLTVISEKRDGNVNARVYANTIVEQIDSLISAGVQPSAITVVGTSKGGYIAQYVSTLANNPKLNFVFIASHQNSDIQNMPEINYCGNILTIFEESDPYGVSAIKRKENSSCTIEQFEEIELHTGLRHGFLFKPLSEWMNPTIKWAKGDYQVDQ